MDKQHILDEIKRVTKANGGKTPGRERFENETGIKLSDWYPHYWLRWGDALQDAGFAPNKFQTAFDQDMLLEKYVGLIRELGHFPVHGEVRRKSKQDPMFPSHTVFDRLGGKQKLAGLIVEYCKAAAGFRMCLIFVRELLLPNLDQRRPTESRASKRWSVLYTS